MTNKQKPNTRRTIIVSALVWVLIVGIVPPLIKLVAYELAGAGAIRAAVGKTVEFRHHDGQRFRGTLEHARYGPNDKWGFFDFKIRIVGDGGIDTGIGPSQLDEVEILQIHSPTERPEVDRHKEAGAPISKEKAKAIAKKHLGLPSEGGCYFEDRGNHYFVAPPYILKADLERAGVYIDKATGELFEKRPAE